MALLPSLDFKVTLFPAEKGPIPFQERPGEAKEARMQIAFPFIDVGS